MSAKAEQAFAYCNDLVRRRDEDRWLAARYAPRDQRKGLHALYALHLEIDRIPAAVSEPPLGEIRLQWWRDAIDDINAGSGPPHPVVEALRATAFLDAAAVQSVKTSIDERARLLYGAPFADVDELAAFLRGAEAYLAVLAARRLAAPLSGTQQDLLESAAVANALARRGLRLAPSLADQIAAHAEREHRRAIGALRQLAPSAAPAAAHFSLTPAYLARRAGPSALAKRWRLFVSIASGRL